jgi:pseudaminic acid cytidylyltransferase
VIAHTITTLGTPPNAPVCCIYPTAPFLDPLDLATGLARLGDAELDYVFSATDYGFPIQRALSIDAAGRVRMLQPEYIGTRSQDLETAYHDAGQFYWGRAGAWVAGRPIFGPASSIVALPRHRVQDIDTPEDWTRAELMFQAYMQARNHA